MVYTKVRHVKAFPECRSSFRIMSSKLAFLPGVGAILEASSRRIAELKGNCICPRILKSSQSILLWHLLPIVQSGSMIAGRREAHIVCMRMPIEMLRR